MADFLKSILSALQTLIVGNSFVSHVIGFAIVIFLICIFIVLVKGEKKYD